MKPEPFNGRHGLRQAQKKLVARHEDIGDNYAYSEIEYSGLRKDNLNFYFNIIKRRKWMVIFIAFLVVPILVLSTISEEQTYQASTRLLIEDDNPQILNIKEITTPDKSKTFFQTEYNLIQIKENIEEVVDTLGLNKESPQKRATFIAKIK